MEIKGPSSTSKTEKTSKTKKGGSSGVGGVFSSLLSGAEETSEKASVAASSGLTGLDAILATQSIDAEEARKSRKRAVARGENLLDSLDELRVGLLTGTISGKRLNRLKELIDQQRDAVDDPRLLAILDEIDLRAAVELAKLSRDEN